MIKDCGAEMAVQHDCCAVQSTDLARIATAERSVAVSVSFALIPYSIVSEPTSFTSRSPLAAFDPGIPRPSSSPTYLLVSVFRL
jgi:hypothetical protein